MLSTGRWKLIIIANALLIIGTIISFFYTNTYFVVIGRFIYGLSAGFFNVVCPKYVIEIAPKEVSGPAGFLF